MIHPEYFGNPGNPFDEDTAHPEHLLFGDSIRNLVSKQILYMIEFQDRINRLMAPDGSLIRQIDIEASAPFYVPRSTFLNDDRRGIKVDPEKPEEVRSKEPLRLILTDFSRDDQIHGRQVKLIRPGGERFGISNIRQGACWESLTIAIGSDSTQVDLIAETGGIPYLIEVGVSTDDKRTLCSSACRSLLRKLEQAEKYTKKEQEPVQAS